MTKLSPASQAVLDAFNGFHELVNRRLKIAAAVEAVADQVASAIPDDCSADVFNRQLKIRFEILAIAAELRGDTTPTETP